MYDFHNQNSFNKIKFEILPLLNNHENIYSIIVVGNKIDYLDINTQKFVIEQDKNEIEKLQDETSINIKYFYMSCKNYINISNIFSEILNSLVNPSHLFYTMKNDQFILKEKFEKSLMRIFRIFDRERKGIITKSEFNKIHENIFDIKLESDHMLAIRECIKIVNSISKNNNQIGITNEDEITQEGFINLNKLAVQVGESQAAWSTIRKFGYNDNLELDSFYFKMRKLIKIEENEFIIELSDLAKLLLIELFNQFKKDSKDTFITQNEFENIFSTNALNLNETFNFSKIFKLDKITIEDWILFWNSFTRINYEESFILFLYLGFDINFDQFVKKIKRNEIKLFNQIEHKTIYVCFIAQSQENINNFIKHFENFYSIPEGFNTKQRDMIIKSENYTIIVKYI